MINWKLRFKNEVTLSTLFVTVVAFIYQILGLFGIVPPVSEDTITKLITLLINIMAALGIIVDPTTAGLGDTKQALGYEVPRVEGDEINGL